MGYSPWFTMFYSSGDELRVCFAANVRTCWKIIIFIYIYTYLNIRTFKYTNSCFGLPPGRFSLARPAMFKHIYIYIHTVYVYIYILYIYTVYIYCIYIYTVYIYTYLIYIGISICGCSVKQTNLSQSPSHCWAHNFKV